MSLSLLSSVVSGGKRRDSRSFTIVQNKQSYATTAVMVSPVTIGNVLIVSASGGNTTVPNCSDSLGHTYTPIASETSTVAGVGSVVARMWYTVVTTAGTPTITWIGPSDLGGNVAEVSGLDTAALVNASVTTTTGTATAIALTSNTLTTTDTCLLWCYSAQESAVIGSHSVTSDWAKLGESVGHIDCTQYKPGASAAGSYFPTIASNNNADVGYVMIAVGFKLA